MVNLLKQVKQIMLKQKIAKTKIYRSQSIFHLQDHHCQSHTVANVQLRVLTPHPPRAGPNSSRDNRRTRRLDALFGFQTFARKYRQGQPQTECPRGRIDSIARSPWSE